MGGYIFGGLRRNGRWAPRSIPDGFRQKPVLISAVSRADAFNPPALQALCGRFDRRFRPARRIGQGGGGNLCPSHVNRLRASWIVRRENDLSGSKIETADQRMFGIPVVDTDRG